jgi:hypothetical protein
MDPLTRSPTEEVHLVAIAGLQIVVDGREIGVLDLGGTVLYVIEGRVFLLDEVEELRMYLEARALTDLNAHLKFF